MKRFIYKYCLFYNMIEKFKDKLIITKTDVKKELGCKDSYAYTVLKRLYKIKKIKKIKK